MDVGKRRVERFRRTTGALENHLVEELSAGRVSGVTRVTRGGFTA